MSFTFTKQKFKNFTYLIVTILLIFLSFATVVHSYPFATFVLDAKTGKALYGLNAEKKLHPASLTKMMTLYLAFNEVENKRMALDQKVTISKNASREPSSKFGYKVGQKVSIRFLIRAAAIRSANDAATALGEAISGSEKAFAEYMTKTAKKMGMHNTQFKNANGLTQTGHISTAKDMAILARRLIYDFPEYYHLFGREKVTASGRILYNTNRKFLARYGGADGIKTGFTSAAGYNLAASARRGEKRVIGVVFGSGSVKLRTLRMTELLDIGFSKAKDHSGFVKLTPISVIPFQDKIGRKGLVFSSSPPLLRPSLLFSEQDSNNINQAIEKLLRFENFNEDEIGDKPLLRPNEIFQTRQNQQRNNDEVLTSKKLLSILEFKDFKNKYNILVGSYYTEYNAKRDFTRLMLSDFETLSGAKRSLVEGVIDKKRVIRIKFSELTELEAKRTCRKLIARNIICNIEPSSTS